MRFLVIALLPGGKTSAETANRHVTVVDAIRMTRWADRGYFLGGQGDGPVGLFSPQDDQFVLIVKKGNLETNTNEFLLLLFQTKDALEHPKPELLVTMSSSSNRDGIKNVKWLDDKTIAFLGENAGGTPEVYTINTKSKIVEKLTSHQTPIVAYDISKDGQEIVFEADPPAQHPLAKDEAERFGVVITTQFPDDLLVGECSASQKPWSAGEELFYQTRGHPASRIPSDDFVTEYEPLSFSPDGRYVLLAVLVKDIPPSWARYQDKLLHPYIVERRKLGSHSNIARYMLFDTAHGDLQPLLDTPMPWLNSGFAWARDSRSVAVSGSYLPLDVMDPVEREIREKKTFVVEVEIPSREIIKITDEPLKISTWDHKSDILLLESDGSSKAHLSYGYRKGGTSWAVVDVAEGKTGTHSPLEVVLQEDINSPPKIFASSLAGGQKSLLLDLNPQFSDVLFGKVEAVSWQSTDGHRVVGGLYLPPDYEPGRRYPLVIQTHGFKKDRFWIDGPWSSAFAAQPLAGNDVVVLQVGYSEDPSVDDALSNTVKEGPWHMGAYEGAIDYLDKRGLIDRSRVGIIGFSRTAFRVAYTLTHSRYQFVAATLADGFEGGYVNYILWGGADSPAVNGGPPFGAALASWLTNSPGFNLDKVHSAVRIEEYGMGSFLGGWQWFSGLSMLEKPVDFVWLPYGTHLLVKPWERVVSQQGNVDWFLFWLKGYEDPAPEKQGQYIRWRELRRRYSPENSSTSGAGH